MYTPKQFTEAKERKMAEGRKLYGPVFQGDPAQELHEEMVDADNYLDELAARGVAIPRHIRIAIRLVARFAATNAKKD